MKMEVTIDSIHCKQSLSAPKYVKEIEVEVIHRLKSIEKSCSKLTDVKQQYYDNVLQVYREAFKKLMSKTVTYNNLLSSIQNSYEKSIKIRDKRLNEFKIQDKVFGSTAKKIEQQIKYKDILVENDNLREHNLKLVFEITKMKQDLGKVQDESFSEYLSLMKERDARYSLYFENVDLHLKLRQLDGAAHPDDVAGGDPVVLRIALDRCREQLSLTQKELKKMRLEYEETVPRQEHDRLQGAHYDALDALDKLAGEHRDLAHKHRDLEAKKKEVDEELSEVRERLSELERAGTPRPAWDVCGDFVGGGRGRWRALAGALGSRDKLRALLRELGPAARTDVLEHFDGLGLDPSIPPYLRYEGKVRNLRLSRREVAVIINDIWVGKVSAGQGLTMQDYVTKYFEERYLQPTMRAEWAYNLCSGAEQMLDECQVKLFWGVLHGHLSEEIYVAHRRQWYSLRDNLYNKGAENITVEEFERVAKSTFPLKSDVDIKNLTDVVRKQLKLKMHHHDINLDKLFQENEEGFDRIELARELYRQRQQAQDKYLREVVAALRGAGRRGGSGGRQAVVTADQLRRAFVIVDPAIDHIRMQKHISWVFGAAPPAAVPLRCVCARLAAADVSRAGPRRADPARSRPPRVVKLL